MGDEVERARRWLAEEGVVGVGGNVWTSGDGPGLLTTNEVAHAWTSVALQDPGLDQVGRLRLALGLLDLLDDYWVTCEIGFTMGSPSEQLARVFWDAYRRRLEAPVSAEPVSYSLWVDWFEDRSTVAVAFAEVLGNDLPRLRSGDRLPEPLARRTRRVLDVSGPVPWPIKFPVYQAAAAAPELHHALLRGLLGSHHDCYGDLDPTAAVALLARLDLPADTPSLGELRTALERLVNEPG